MAEILILLAGVLIGLIVVAATITAVIYLIMSMAQRKTETREKAGNREL